MQRPHGPRRQPQPPLRPQRLTKHKESALRQAEKGLSHLTAARSEASIYMGIKIEKFTADARAYFAGGTSKLPLIGLIS